MSKLYLTLGRIGDVISQIPMLYADFQKTGQKSSMMVAKEFASVLDGCSYINPVIWDGDYMDLEGAVKLARTLSDDVIVTSLHGTNDELERYTYSQVQSTGCVTSNFQLEQWNLAGRAKEFYDNLPLVFDSRSPEREKLLLDANGFKRQNKKPVMLLAVDGGVTAPFPHAALLKDYVRSKFGKDYRIIDLPMVAKPDGRIYDLLAVMEQSALMIASDSMPLHLAWAVRDLPVFALTNDKPSLWHGAPWRPNHLWYCRYHDWPARAVEMCHAIENFEPAETDWEPTSVAVGYIPSTSNGSAFACVVGIRPGMCSREFNGRPFVKDAVRMGMQRSSSDEVQISLRRQGISKSLDLENILRSEPTYAYRISNGQHSPIVDLFSAPKSFWLKILPEIPDLVLDNQDVYWSEALAMIFRRHGAKDCTGACEYVKEAA